MADIETQWGSLTLVSGRWNAADRAIAQLIESLQTLRIELASKHVTYKLA